jgi:hypothetical protein
MINSRWAFALLCALGIVAILCGIALEISRFRRGSGLISPRQFRIRMVSAVLWLIIVGANLYAVTALWPEGTASGLSQEEAKAQARLFLLVVGGAFSLVIVALGLFAWDLVSISKERHIHEAKFLNEIAEAARAEALKRDAINKQTGTAVELSPSPPPPTMPAAGTSGESGPKSPDAAPQ